MDRVYNEIEFQFIIILILSASLVNGMSIGCEIELITILISNQHSEMHWFTLAHRYEQAISTLSDCKVWSFKFESKLIIFDFVWVHTPLNGYKSEAHFID